MAEKSLSAAALARRAREYFEKARGEPLLDEDGRPVMNRGSPVVRGGYPVTLAGLACALDMTRTELLEYPEEGERGRVVRRAKAEAEACAEAALYESGASSGAKYALSRNFDWDEVPAHSRALWQMSDEELSKRIDELEKA